MNSTMHAPPVRYTAYPPPTSYSYDPPLFPREYFVLDLSKKSSNHMISPDPSPKSSPISYVSRDGYECTEYSLQSPEELQSHPYGPSPESSCSPLSPRSTISSVSVSETDAPALIHKKNMRPFKCLGKDPVTDYLGSAYATSSIIVDDSDLDSEEIKRLMEESARKYAEFKEKMLGQLRNNNNVTNHNMRRLQNNDHKTSDAEYLEKRRKNNEAAKRSRDARRDKQDDTAIRATFLEQENIMLRLHLKAEREDLERLRKMELERETIL